MRRFLFGARVAVPARPVHPDRDRARSRARGRGAGVHLLRARRDPDGGADGRGDRGARRPLGPGHRRPAQRHLRQRARADHRAVRAARGAAGGRQGVAGRLDPRQHPAGHGRRDARRRLEARAPEASTAPRRSAQATDAAAAGRRARRCRRSSSSSPAGACRARAPSRSTTTATRAPVARRRDRAADNLRRGAVLLAQDPPRPVQPRATPTTRQRRAAWSVRSER